MFYLSSFIRPQRTLAVMSSLCMVAFSQLQKYRKEEELKHIITVLFSKQYFIKASLKISFVFLKEEIYYYNDKNFLEMEPKIFIVASCMLIVFNIKSRF